MGAKGNFSNVLLFESRPVLLSKVRSKNSGEGKSDFKSFVGDAGSVELDEYGEFVADDVETNNGDAIHRGDPVICLSNKEEERGSSRVMFKLKQDAEGSNVLETKLALSNLGFTDTNPSLTIDDDISGGKDNSSCILGDKVEELDDNGESIPIPSLSIELVSSGAQSRSSSKIPSNMESSVNGIILSVIVFYDVFFRN